MSWNVRADRSLACLPGSLYGGVVSWVGGELLCDSESGVWVMNPRALERRARGTLVELLGVWSVQLSLSTGAFLLNRVGLGRYATSGCPEATEKRWTYAAT